MYVSCHTGADTVDGLKKAAQVVLPLLRRLFIGSPCMPKWFEYLDLCDVENLPNGNVLTLGQGDMGQLGLGDEILSRKKPAVVKELADIKIKKIVAGALHSVCLTDDNKVS